MCIESTLLYIKPASDWETQALPIGNGRLGAMIFGGVATDQIQFNEETLYTGRPSEADSQAYKTLPSIRRLLSQKQYVQAQKLVDNDFLESAAYGTASDFGLYQNFGTILVTLHDNDESALYRRTLDMKDGVARVSYAKDGARYDRTYIASHPADLIAVHYAVHGSAAGLNAAIRLAGTHAEDRIFVSEQGDLLLAGSLDHLDYEARLRVCCKGGKIGYGDGFLQVQEAQEFTIYLSACSDYDPNSENLRGKCPEQINRSVLDLALRSDFPRIFQQHCDDFRALSQKNQLQLSGSSDKTGIPTDQRLAAYKQGAADNGLETLLYQYGRYMLISSSRSNTLPANLQGIWNNSNDPTWGSIFCYNINFNMIYWCAETTGLSDCHLAAIRFIRSLQHWGKQAAKAYFHAPGWFASKKSDIWGFTKPYAKSVYGLFMGGSGWLCQDIWEHFSFGRDFAYLKETAYPIMKSAAQFYLTTLWENPDGFLVTCPASSPENSYLLDGVKLNVCDGTEMDIRIIEGLFTNCLQAADILGVEDDFTSAVRQALEKLPPPRIGQGALIQEWYQDFEQAEPSHRHLSFVYGLHPAQLITLETHPDLAKACANTVLARGESDVGWSIAWRIPIWARLKDSCRAYQNLRTLITKRMADNLFCVESPFQMDGNAGLTAGMAEMLLQSSFDSTLLLLPALPQEWDSGFVTGLCARGGFTVDLYWENHTLTRAVIHGVFGSEGCAVYRHIQQSFKIPTQGSIELSFTM